MKLLPVPFRSLDTEQSRSWFNRIWRARHTRTDGADQFSDWDSSIPPPGHIRRAPDWEA